MSEDKKVPPPNCTEEHIPPVQRTKTEIAKRLENHYGEDLAEIYDEELRAEALRTVLPLHWDRLTAKERRQAVMLNFEEHGEEYCDLFDMACEKIRVEQYITEMELTPAETPSELTHKKDALQKLRIEQKKLAGALQDRCKVDASDFVIGLRAKDKQEWEIVLALLQEYKSSDFQLGNLLPANPKKRIKPDSIRRRGAKLREIAHKKRSEKIRNQYT